MKKLTTLIVAILFTGGMAIAQTNDASIDQVGDDHEATISQSGTMNTAYVEQTADAGREGADVGTATVTQTGAENYANLRQRSFYGDSEASIVQLGDRNSVQGQTDTDDFYQNHGLNILDVVMDGNDNTLYSLAGEAQKNVNTFLLDVIGNENKVGTRQHGGYADVVIEGDLNNVTLAQQASPVDIGNSAYVDIFGSENTVGISQNGPAHTANVNVNGDFNTSSITQGN
ncbi:MAG: hypothetical protein WD357_10445 [Gracilimonas sp.]